MALVAAVALAGVVALRIASWRPLAVVGSPTEDGYVRISGVVHVHTSLSDGGGTPDEVIRDASDAGARFVIITDHNNVDAKSSEGYRHGVLVIVGTEVSTTAGHLLGLGTADPTYRFSGDPLDALEDIRDLGGFAVAAHPLSPRADLRFTGWDLPGPWGLELVNGDSEWRRAGARILLTAALYGLNHRFALLRSLTSPAATLARWDEMLAHRDVAGLAGADAHSRLPITKAWALRFPSYRSLFELFRNHVVLQAPVTGAFEADRAAVLEALRRGHSYVGLDALAPADDFSFVAEARGRRYTMGDTVPPLEGLRLKAGGRLPERARLLLLRDGKLVAEAPSSLDVRVPGPGVYRVEVHVSGLTVPWILSNPIYVFDDATLAERERSAAGPPSPDPPSPAVTLDDFEGKTTFQPAADPLSTVGREVLDARSGRNGKGAARLEFCIGEPTPDHPHVFAALVDWTHRDLSGRSGLAFSIRAGGVYRIWVQVRDENPASADEGTEWWFASVKTSTEWQRVALPFAHLRSINPKTDGRLDLDKVRAIVFVLDRGAIKPSTCGTIWLDELGVY